MFCSLPSEYHYYNALKILIHEQIIQYLHCLVFSVCRGKSHLASTCMVPLNNSNFGLTAHLLLHDALQLIHNDVTIATG